MKFFLECASGPDTIGIINRLIRRYQPEACYITCMSPDQKKEVEGYVAACYWMQHLVTADYSSYLFANDAPPLNEALLKAMAPYESGIMKIFERFGEYVAIDYESRVRMYHRHLRYWNHMLDVAEIDVAVFLNIPHGINYIIYCLCKMKGVATATYYYGHLSGYMVFFKDIKEHAPEVMNHYQKLLSAYKDSSIDDIELPPDYQKTFDLYSCKSQDRTPHYMKKNNASIFKRGKGFLDKVIAYLLECHRLSAKERCRKIFLSAYACFSHLFTSVKSFFLKRQYDRLSSPPDFKRPYIYFPLHYQPELTTHPLGGVFVNQLLVAQMLSFYLPESVQLYVKEHPKQSGYCRDFEFYRDLAALPNVKLVPRSTDTYELIENSIAVASVTGTVGFEGLFAGKPFLMFGSFIFMYAPGTFNIRNNEDCKHAIKAILKNGPKHTLKDMKLYLKALSEVESRNSAWDYFITPISKEQNISDIAEGLARIIDEQTELRRG